MEHDALECNAINDHKDHLIYEEPGSEDEIVLLAL